LSVEYYIATMQADGVNVSSVYLKFDCA